MRGVEIVADTIRREHRLGPSLERYATGSVPVFRAGDHVIKLFGVADRAFFETEHRALERVLNALPIPTPEVVATGAREGWCYVVMTRLEGVLLSEVWEQIDPPSRVALVREVGAAIGALRSLDTRHLEALAVDWPRFVASRRVACVEHQRAKGLAASWLERIDAFLEEHLPANAERRAILHTEIMREHLLVEQREGRWRCSGLFDFEPAMIGAPEYELTSVGIFVTAGDRRLLSALLEGIGSAAPHVPEQVMSYALIHRYSNLPWYFERVPPPREVADFEALAHVWFGA